jgi:hypothetical protein
MNKIIIFFIEWYQKNFSPELKGSFCKFTPHCSEYSKRCFQKYNFFKASFKSIFRILRCNPLSKGGKDLP